MGEGGWIWGSSGKQSHGITGLEAPWAGWPSVPWSTPGHTALCWNEGGCPRATRQPGSMRLGVWVRLPQPDTEIQLPRIHNIKKIDNKQITITTTSCAGPISDLVHIRAFHRDSPLRRRRHQSTQVTRPHTAGFECRQARPGIRALDCDVTLLVSGLSVTESEKHLSSRIALLSPPVPHHRPPHTEPSWIDNYAQERGSLFTRHTTPLQQAYALQTKVTSMEMTAV